MKHGVAVGEIGPTTDWSTALRDVQVVVHLAARVHVMHDTNADPLAAYREVNTDGALNLASQAVAHGVRRFVYVSSIKVNGEETMPDRPFTEEDHPAPLNPYGISKLEAEQLLSDIAATTNMEVVIIRPSLVYGPQVKANFLRLLQIVNNGLPLPFASVRNKRSLIFLDNLIDFIMCCLTHPAASGETFFVSDGEDLSISELIRRIAFHMGRPARLLSVPEKLLQFGAKLTAKTAEIDRLCGSLQVDISKAKRILGWIPPISVDEGIKKTVEWFVSTNITDPEC